MSLCVCAHVCLCVEYLTVTESKDCICVAIKSNKKDKKNIFLKMMSY